MTSKTTPHSEVDRNTAIAYAAIDAIETAFSERKWTAGTSVAAFLGVMARRAILHLRAVIVECHQGDLVAVCDGHCRQMLELLLQVREIAAVELGEAERLAHKAVAWSCNDWIEKLELVARDVDVEGALAEATHSWGSFDQGVKDEVKADRHKGQRYWFGGTFDQLAKRRTRAGERLRDFYHWSSAEGHEAWVPYLSAAPTSPGHVDFTEYPTDEVRDSMRADAIMKATNLAGDIWNEVAAFVALRGVAIDWRQGNAESQGT